VAGDPLWEYNSGSLLFGDEHPQRQKSEATRRGYAIDFMVID
jgi:hypothetical protein